MLDTAGKIWSKLQDFVKDISDLKSHDKETDKELSHLQREVAILAKDAEHHAKIQTHQGLELEALKERLRKVESERHGLAVKLGKQKAANERLVAPRLPLDEAEVKKPRARKN